MIAGTVVLPLLVPFDVCCPELCSELLLSGRMEELRYYRHSNTIFDSCERERDDSATLQLFHPAVHLNENPPQRSTQGHFEFGTAVKV